MKKLFSSLIILVFCHSIWGQNLVSIPDSSFRRQLKAQFPNSFVGQLLDTSLAKNEMGRLNGYLSIYSYDLKSIEGIQYFKSITQLLVNYTSISILSKLPNQIEYLSLSGNDDLVKIESFPNSLENLYMHGNIKLDSIPTIPNKLRQFDLTFTSLKEVPNIPDSLTYFRCYANKIEFMPDINSKNLTSVDISNNQLAICPAFGRSLRSISCNANPFKCLKTLPYELEYLFTDVSCIPNAPRRYGIGMFQGNTTSGISTTSGFLPICASNNPDACFTNQFSQPIISGKVYADLNQNGQKDTLENGIAYAVIRINPGNYTIYADVNGDYSFEADTINSFVLNPNSISGYNIINPVQLSILTASSWTDVNFGYRPSSLNNSPIISGKVYADLNQNGQKDMLENGIAYAVIRINPGNYTIYADVNGDYSFAADTIENYSIVVDSILNYLTPNPVLLSKLHFNSITNVDFGLHRKFKPIIYGSVFNDVNNNNINDSTDIPVRYQNILINPGNKTVTSDNFGNYEFEADTLTSYTLELESDSNTRQYISNLSINSRNKIDFPIHFNTGYLIPDTSFRRQLIEQFPNCFVGDMLDTIAAKKATGYLGNLYVNYNVYSLEGIKYFQLINSIWIRETLIRTIPKLGNQVNYLFAGGNPNLAKLDSLPDSLVTLYVVNNLNLDSIPYFPQTLERIAAYYNNIKYLPGLPNKLKSLELNNNNLQTLPILPKSLQYLDVRNNKLTAIPNIPDSLSIFSCGNNKITEIPSLDSKFLKYVDFGGNELTKCPTFGPNIQSIGSFFNRFTCLSKLPDSLIYLDTDVNCLPNIPKNNRFQTATLSSGLVLQVCNPTNNPSNCNANPIVSGTVYYDLNNNQIYDLGDTPVENGKITISPFGGTIFTNALGQYVYSMDTVGTYVLSLATVPYFTVSPQATVNGSSMNSTTTANFYLTKIADAKDMAISITPYQAAARPGFYFSLNVEVKNNGSLPTPSTLTFNLPSQYSVTGILFPNCTSSSAINSCSIGTLKPGQIVSGKIEGRLFTTATLGDSLVFETTVNNADASDANLGDNVSSTAMIIRGSYDPNDKAATNLNPSKVGQSQWIDYTIRFQNTGTDTAFTVVVSDSLPSQLLATSVELLSASHTCKFSQTGSVLYFQFDNILLPDSNTNEKLSNGYIKFRAKTKPNLSLQSTVNNRAAIYFDYNSPIITNFATSTFVQPGRVTAVYTNAYQSNETWVYPNPIQNGRLFVRKFNNESVRLFNSSGYLMFQGVINEDGLNVNDYPTGIYLIQSDKLKEKIVIE